MSMKRIYFILFIILYFASFSADKRINPKDTLIQILNDHVGETSLDYIKFHDQMRFKVSYLKIGYFSNQKVKSAIIIYSSTDSSIIAELFSFKNSKWIETDKKELDAKWLVFDIKFDDYNFDGFGDIYINVDVSNGLGLSRGHLLTLVNDKLVQHPETRDIADMKPNKIKKIINAKYPLYCNDSKTTCDVDYKWIDKKLVLQSKLCTCK